MGCRNITVHSELNLELGHKQTNNEKYYQTQILLQWTTMTQHNFHVSGSIVSQKARCHIQLYLQRSILICLGVPPTSKCLKKTHGKYFKSYHRNWIKEGLLPTDEICSSEELPLKSLGRRCYISYSLLRFIFC